MYSRETEIKENTHVNLYFKTDLPKPLCKEDERGRLPLFKADMKKI